VARLASRRRLPGWLAPRERPRLGRGTPLRARRRGYRRRGRCRSLRGDHPGGGRDLDLGRPDERPDRLGPGLRGLRFGPLRRRIGPGLTSTGCRPLRRRLLSERRRHPRGRPYRPLGRHRLVCARLERRRRRRPPASPSFADVRALAVSGADLFVGGNFQNVAGIAVADFIARWGSRRHGSPSSLLAVPSATKTWMPALQPSRR
jgi:hypothetical protein